LIRRSPRRTPLQQIVDPFASIGVIRGQNFFLGKRGEIFQTGRRLERGSGQKAVSRHLSFPFFRVSVEGPTQPGAKGVDHMNQLIQSKNFTTVIVSAVALVCIGFSPKMQAVSPPPDGCYPGFTTAEGCNALAVLTTGAGNTAVGWYSLFLDTSGNYNTGLGAGALVLNNADSNTAVGTGAMLLNTTGGGNTALGTDALLYNNSGILNNAVGAFALLTTSTDRATALLAQARSLRIFTAFLTLPWVFLRSRIMT
jgi:hypothetical protein